MATLKIEVTDEDDEVVYTSEKATEVAEDDKDKVIAALEKALTALKAE